MSATIGRQPPTTPADRARLRKRMADAVERLIAAMDALDGDPDAEPNLGAPELSATCTVSVYTAGFGWRSFQAGQEQWAKGANDDREAVDEDGTDLDRGELDTSDGEADIGASENVDQTRWGHGSRQDGLEPSLGAPEGHVDQTRWCQGGHRDLEGDAHA